MGSMKSLNASRRERKPRPQQGGRRAYKTKPPFIAVEGIKSLAWDMLSRDAVWVLNEFYRKFNGFNRSNLSLTYGEVREKISNGTFSKAIWELIGFGFIDRIREGRLERNASIYGISDRWKAFEGKEKKLFRIERLLKHAERVHRVKTPKNLSQEEQNKFKFKRRRMRRAILKKVAEGGRMARNISRSLQGGAKNTAKNLPGDAISTRVTSPGNPTALPDRVENVTEPQVGE